MSRTIVITGGRGFIGRTLAFYLYELGYKIVLLSRNPEKASQDLKENFRIVKWDGKTGNGWFNYADDAFAIINLAGENIGSRRWTRRKKEAIISSRVNAANAVIDAIHKSEKKPKIVVQASGVGFYGNHGDELVDESFPQGKGFLPELALQWEDAINPVKEHVSRLIIIRMGVVLGYDGGLLDKITLPYKLFVGGHVGEGQQWISWIHIDDVTGAIRFLMENEESYGVFNITTPNPVRSKKLFKMVGKALGRPSFFKVPEFAVKFAFGEMGEEMMLQGQRVIPRKLVDAEYEFLFPTIESALMNILD